MSQSSHRHVQSWCEGILGNPEGRYAAPCGWMLRDDLSGKLYIKKTREELNTGWEVIVTSPTGENISGGASLIGEGSPEGVITADPGTQYFDALTDSRWMKKSGTGNTGWV